jgi:hypothetical protein
MKNETLIKNKSTIHNNILLINGRVYKLWGDNIGNHNPTPPEGGYIVKVIDTVLREGGKRLPINFISELVAKIGIDDREDDLFPDLPHKFYIDGRFCEQTDKQSDNDRIRIAVTCHDVTEGATNSLSIIAYGRKDGGR